MSDTSDTGEHGSLRAGESGDQAGVKAANIEILIPGVDAPFEVRARALFDAYLTIHAVGAERARSAMIFGALLLQKLHASDAPIGSFERVLGMLEDEAAPPGSDRWDLEPHVLGFCYLLLRERVISWEQAAGFATELLNVSPPIGAEAWRKKTERWIERTGRAKVGKRRPSEETGRP